MSARKKSTVALKLYIAGLCLSPVMAICAAEPSPSFCGFAPDHTLAQDTIAQELGWVPDPLAKCGGYFVDKAFKYPVEPGQKNSVTISGGGGLYAQKGASILEGRVTITREGQQITANKMYLYRDPETFKLTSAEMIGDVHLREPNTVILGKRGRYNFISKAKSLLEIFYRTSLSQQHIIGPNVPRTAIQEERKVDAMSAWGQANEFSQNEPKVYDLCQASFSTCAPTSPAWRVKASHIVLNKNTGRGYATHAKIYVKDVPVFYIPYLNFSIDRQRKSGFLWPIVGLSSTQWGPYFLAPYYWNMAPNYDMTITPGYLAKRSFQISDNYRYLTESSKGYINANIVPHDKYFATTFKTDQYNDFHNSKSHVKQAELNRLLNASNTRSGYVWRNESQFNQHWSSHVDFNYASDDYYLQDFGSTINDVTQNQLAQYGDINYKAENWNFIGRIQSYQTLHPVNETDIKNQYRRLPQLILNGDYPDQKFGLEYFINNEVTHFDILKNPGANNHGCRIHHHCENGDCLTRLPMGERANVQPGVSLPIYTPYFFINPRIQLALTNYALYQTKQTCTPRSIFRSVPIYDVASGLSFNRDTCFCNTTYNQVLEPQLYYVYIPYRKQNRIPLFDTTVNELTYDQIFNYNRFTGIDRIGDANQVGVGVTTRLIDQNTGIEKLRLGIGNIIYFAHRRVDTCVGEQCTDNPENHSNFQRLSPISGLLRYYIQDNWGLDANAIWNPISRQLDNSSVGVNYRPKENAVLHVGFNYVHNGDIYAGTNINSSQNNIKLTNITSIWPITDNFTTLLRWDQDWSVLNSTQNRNNKVKIGMRLQNLILGLQYDTCCWAVRLAGGTEFKGLDGRHHNKAKYNNEFYIQFALKGLGNLGSERTGGILSSISGYDTTRFGREI